jgi:molybdopterin/thiamine biosynthesis adenylyltransferase
MTEPTASLKSIRFVSAGIFPKGIGESGPTARQELIPGFVQGELNRLRPLLIGAGGINSEIGLSLARKGIGQLNIFDADTVELSNLNRQRFFEKDLYKNKAESLAKNLMPEAVARCLITAYPVRFQNAVDEERIPPADMVICGVDNNETRSMVSRFFLKTTPIIFAAVSEDADHGYVFVQEPGKACYGCLFPDSVNDLTQHPCSPAVIDILKVVGGLAVYAVDTLVMKRKRNWNYKEIFLSGFVPERNTEIPKRSDCPICSLKGV